MFEIFLNASQVTLLWPVLLGLGFCVGLLSGMLGVGGGWLITPALNILGLPIAYAVGTGLAQMTGTSFIASLKHYREKNVELKLGIAVGLPMIIGVKFGKFTMSAWEKTGNAESYTSIMYIILLSIMGVLLISEFIPRKNKQKRNEEEASAASQFINSLPLGPKIQLPQSKRETPLLFLIVMGVFAGVLSGIMGVGGGFLLMPIMNLLVGVSTLTAVATSLICVFISGVSGTILYSLENQVDWPAVGILFSGATIGSYLGVHSTRYVKGRGLRFLFACLVLLAALSVLLKFLGKTDLATITIFVPAVLLCVISLGVLIKGVYFKKE
jgi:uncharacterized protein